MTLPPIDISPQELLIVHNILSKYVPHQEVWVFGSRAKGTARRYSDLDLAIITTSPMPFEIRGGMIEDFSESDLPFRVDILDWVSTEDTFRRIVEAERVILQPIAHK